MQCSQPAQATKQVHADQSAKTQTSRQSWLEPASSSIIIDTARCVFKTNEVEIFPAYKIYNHSQDKQLLSWCDVASILLLLSVLSISSMHAASGLFLWTMELLAFASRQFAPKTMDVRFIHSYLVQLSLVSERSGRREPPGKRSAWYTYA